MKFQNILVFLVLLAGTAAGEPSLSTLLTRRTDLRISLEKTLASQDLKSFWHGKGVNDFVHFFDEWRTYRLTPETALLHMNRLMSFYENSEMGIAIMRDPEFSKWLKEFVLARKAFLDSKESALIAREWAQQNEAHMNEYQIPPNGFRSFNEFFTRELKPGMRPIVEPENNHVLVSPADCQLSEVSEWVIKGQKFDVASLLGDKKLGKLFSGGRALLCILMPINYHHFHAPIAGKMVYTQKLGGLYFGARGFVDHFHEYHRGVAVINTGKTGKVGFVAVGIAEISSVNFSKQTDDQVKKGEEFGFFSYGGSAIVMLFEPKRLAPSEKPLSGATRVGQAIGALRDR